MYRHAWESVLSYCKRDDLVRSIRVQRMTLDAAKHMKVACFTVEYDTEQLKRLPALSASTSVVTRHITCILRSNVSSIRDTLTSATQKGYIVSGINLVDQLSIDQGEYIIQDVLLLHTTKCIKHVELSYLYIHHIGKYILALTNVLRTPTCIESVDLRCSQLGAEGLATLADVLKLDVCIIKWINLKNIRATPKGIIALARALRTNRHIHTIDLSANYVGDEGAVALADALRTNTHIEWFNLSNNGIGTRGVIALADAFKSSTCSIRYINLSHNNASNEGAMALADALRSNTSIKMMNLNINKVSTQGIIALCNALKVNTCMESVYLINDIIGEEGIAALQSVKASNTTIQCIEWHAGFIYDDDRFISDIDIRKQLDIIRRQAPTLI